VRRDGWAADTPLTYRRLSTRGAGALLIIRPGESTPVAARDDGDAGSAGGGPAGGLGGWLVALLVAARGPGAIAKLRRWAARAHLVAGAVSHIFLQIEARHTRTPQVGVYGDHACRT